MEYRYIGGIHTSRVVLGCMRIAEKPIAYLRRLIDVALDCGINIFDHADIYGGGRCEELYGKLIADDKALRQNIVLQTKCGIRNKWYDFSYEHIIQSVEGSLKRLNTDYIDILLLHRPDTLMRPEEVARAFDDLEKSGKVRVFGVSNFSARQTEYLQTVVNQKLHVNQVRLGIVHCPIIENGIVDPEHSDGTLEYCRQHGVTLQCYSPMQCAFTDDSGHYFSGAFTDGPARKKFFALNFLLEGLAQKYNTTPESIAVGWILRHPAGMQPVLGTTRDDRLARIRDCCEINLTAYEWYQIYEAAVHKIP